MNKITITDVRVLPGDSAFLLDNGNTTILYDTGFGFTGDGVADNIRNVLGQRQLDYIFLSHSHYDHALGSPNVSRVYPNAKIVAGSYAASIFGKPTARAVMRDMDRKAAAGRGMTDYEDLVDQLRVDIAVEDGQIITCGDLRVQVVGLPGHTKCSVGYYLPDYQMLLGSETLGVYIGPGVCMPCYLVGYQMTLDSFQKVRAMDIQRFLLPHYGLVEGEEAAGYLDVAEQASRENARVIQDLTQAGKSQEEICAYLEETTYLPNVWDKYPVDAFRLNTNIMVRMIRKELEKE